MSVSPDEIAAYARQYGLDPAYADAVASRESSFNPNARASKSVYGLFQMNGANRAKYGVPYGADVQTQVRGFADFTNDLKKDMTAALGREPTSQELYLGHYWGPQRAAGIISGHYASLPARDVFSPQELAANPNIDPDKPVGDIASGIMGDMGKRTARYGGGQGDSAVADLTGYGSADDTSPAANTSPEPKPPTSTKTADFTGYGSPADADPETSAAISSLAQNDSGDVKDVAGRLGSIGNSAAAADQSLAPKPPAMPDPDRDYIESAMLQRQIGPVGGVATMPGQQPQASSALPGGTKAPGFNPAMFGAAPNPQQQQQA